MPIYPKEWMGTACQPDKTKSCLKVYAIMVVHVLIAAGLLLAMEGKTDVSNVDVYNKHYNQLKPLFLFWGVTSGARGVEGRGGSDVTYVV